MMVSRKTARIVRRVESVGFWLGAIIGGGSVAYLTIGTVIVGVLGR